MKQSEWNRKDKSTREYIAKKFSEFYIKKWKSKGLTAEAFARCVSAEMPGISPCDNKYVSSWLHGKKVPEKYLGAICKVLEVDISEFFPSGSEEQYRYSADYQNDVAIWQDQVAENCFGLNLSLIMGLKSLIDFDTAFPAYMPLQPVSADPEEGYPFGIRYERMDALEAAEASKGDGLFQLHRDGKVINLSPADMKFLKVVQESIIKFVSALFDHHREELAFAAKSATNKCKSLLQPGKVIEMDNLSLSADALQKIDSYGFYTADERKRYKIPAEPEELAITAAYIQKPLVIRPHLDVKTIKEFHDMLTPGTVERVDADKAVDYDPGHAMDDNKDKMQEEGEQP